MKKIILVILLISSSVTFAQNKNAKATLEVDGVCNMCKTRIEKACLKTKGVKSAVWNVETHQLNLIYNDTKTNVETIEKNINKVGHDTKKNKANDEAYANLHPCCKYRSEEIIQEHEE